MAVHSAFVGLWVAVTPSQMLDNSAPVFPSYVVKKEDLTAKPIPADCAIYERGQLVGYSLRCNKQSKNDAVR